MVLMCILATVSENEIGRDRLQLLKSCFYLGTCKRQESISESLEHRAPQVGAADEEISRSSRLRFPDAVGAEYNPVKCTARILLGQPEDRASAANFDIVGVGANAQNRKRSSGPRF